MAEGAEDDAGEASEEEPRDLLDSVRGIVYRLVELYHWPLSVAWEQSWFDVHGLLSERTRRERKRQAKPAVPPLPDGGSFKADILAAERAKAMETR